MFFAKLRDAVRVMFPGRVPQHLSRLVARLESECRPRSKAARIVTSSRLVALGTKLMEGSTGVEAKITAAVRYRDGLMIALLALRPVRLRTFSLIRVGTHLRQVGEEWRMIFEGPESKSGRALKLRYRKISFRFLSITSERYVRSSPEPTGITESGPAQKAVRLPLMRSPM